MGPVLLPDEDHMTPDLMGVFAPLPKQWVAVDCPMNRAWAPQLIGKLFTSPPSYLVVREILSNREHT
jgi:hypothetical protein